MKTVVWYGVALTANPFDEYMHKAIAVFFVGFVLLMCGMTCGVHAQDSLKSAYVSRMESFFRESSKTSSRELEEERASIRQNQLMEEVKALGAQSQSFLKKGYDSVQLVRRIDQINRWHDIAKDGVFVHIGTAQSSRNLTATYHVLDALSLEVLRSKNRIDKYQEQLSGFRFHIDSLMNDRAFFVFPRDSVDLANYVQRLRVLAVEVSPVNRKLKQQINSVQELQNRINLELMKLRAEMEEIQFFQGRLSDRAWQREFVNIWEPSSFDRPWQDILFFSMAKAKLVFLYYLRAHWGKLVLFLLITAMAVAYGFTLRKGVRQNGNLTAENSLLLRYPFCSGLTIGFSVMQFIFPAPPFVLTIIVLIACAILVSFILKNAITGYWMFVWISISMAFICAGLDNLLLQPSRWERWIMLGISVFAVGIGLLALLHRRQHEGLKERWILYPIGAMVLMELGSVLLNIFGRFNLSKVLLIAGLTNVVAAVVFLWVLRLVNEGLKFASLLHKQQERRLFYINYNRVGQRAPMFFYVLLIVGWFVLFGRNFYEFRLLADPLKDFFQTQHQLGSYSFSVYNLSIFFVIMVGATVLSKIVSFFASDPQWNTRDEQQRRKFHLGSWILLIRISIITLGLFLAFSAVGIPIEQLSIVVGALGVGIGFGLQTLVNNLVSGLIIAFEKPVNVDDQIDIGGQSGKVKSIGFRSSVIATADGADLIMPNGDLLNAHVVNWTLGGYRKRLHVRLNVQYGTDLDRVKTLLLHIIDEDEQILGSPLPVVQFGEVTAHAVSVDLFFWVRTLKDAGQVKSDLVSKIHTIFQREGLSFSLPLQKVIIDQFIKPDVTAQKRND
ncbi:mechanosensitive ion channel family protein [Sphingobacterium suaedae]|uniref:Mechanosensitive ion channel family protein n=1 Tax=Sphingobacterium suaedae TaxID=1686402 RepID=A0ABW5KJ79_9SPHI